MSQMTLNFQTHDSKFKPWRSEAEHATSLSRRPPHEQLAKSMYKKLKTIGIFIDLKKAFDTFDHSLLIKKLNSYGIRGVASSWITSYLDKRSQYVYYNDVKSDTIDITCRVPQGSFLGQKLFILYINDMVNVSKLFKFIIFADDTNQCCLKRYIVKAIVKSWVLAGQWAPIIQCDPWKFHKKVTVMTRALTNSHGPRSYRAQH